MAIPAELSRSVAKEKKGLKIEKITQWKTSPFIAFLYILVRLYHENELGITRAVETTLTHMNTILDDLSTMATWKISAFELSR